MLTPDPWGKRPTGFNAILGGCEWDVVLALLDEMDRRRVAKDSLTFSTAITACERAEECLGMPGRVGSLRPRFSAQKLWTLW